MLTMKTRHDTYDTAWHKMSKQRRRACNRWSSSNLTTGSGGGHSTQKSIFKSCHTGSLEDYWKLEENAISAQGPWAGGFLRQDHRITVFTCIYQDMARHIMNIHELSWHIRVFRRLPCTEPPDFHARLGKCAALQCVVLLWSCGGCYIVTISHLPPHPSTSHFATLQRAVCVLQDPAAYQNKQRKPKFTKCESQTQQTQAMSCHHSEGDASMSRWNL